MVRHTNCRIYFASNLSAYVCVNSLLLTKNTNMWRTSSKLLFIFYDSKISKIVKYDENKTLKFSVQNPTVVHCIDEGKQFFGLIFYHHFIPQILKIIKMRWFVVNVGLYIDTFFILIPSHEYWWEHLNLSNVILGQMFRDVHVDLIKQTLILLACKFLAQQEFNCKPLIVKHKLIS